jgi:Fe-Mn family superoxide dismutase
MSKDITKIVRQTLGLSGEAVKDAKRLNEALVADPKPFSLPTEFQSAGTKRNHFELYENYIKTFNRISAELDSADRTEVNSNNSQFRSLKIDETYNMNAIFLHELYFANISDLHSKITMDSLTYMRLQRDFGTFDKWQEDFLACCQASRCGWAVTYYNLFTQTYMNASIDLHSIEVPVGCFPVIVMDVWQHAYYKDYLKDVKTYSIAMMKELNWRVIEDRFKQSERVAQAMRSL